MDPSIFCVLTAKSRDLAAPLADFLTFSPRWDVASSMFLFCLNLYKDAVQLTDGNTTDTYRPPYYHRNAASELMGLIYGEYGGRSDAFKPGSVSYECGSKYSLLTHPISPYTYTLYIVNIIIRIIIINKKWSPTASPTQNSKPPPKPHCQPCKSHRLPSPSCSSPAHSSPSPSLRLQATKSTSMSRRCGMIWWIIFRGLGGRLRG